MFIYAQLLIVIHEYISFISLVSSVICAKTGINYPDLKPGCEFWKRSGSHYAVPATATDH